MKQKIKSLGRTYAPVPLALGVIDGFYVVQRNPRWRYAGMALAWRLVDAGLGGFPFVLGIWGSDTAKFSRFVRPFSEIRRYTQGQMSEDELVGHNPLGALMVIALLAALVFQTATGLFCRR